MNAYTIDLLAAYNPESHLPPISTTVMQRQAKFSPLHDAARERFLAKYVQTNFGWYIAKQYASRKLPFPVLLSGRDIWVYKAYLFCLDSWQNYDENIAEAYHLATFVNGMPNLRQHLKALLLTFQDSSTPDSHIREVALKTGVSIGTIDAFEALFFNVIDRRGDGMYLANEVYPNTRLVEFDEDYLKNASNEDLIKRVAYNHRDLDLAAYLTGLGDHSYLRKIAASDDREAELTRFLMGNGLILAHANLLNQRTVGLSRASTLLAASRQSGNNQEEPTLTGIVPMYSEAFQRALSANKEMVLEQMKEDSGFLEV